MSSRTYGHLQELNGDVIPRLWLGLLLSRLLARRDSRLTLTFTLSHRCGVCLFWEQCPCLDARAAHHSPVRRRRDSIRSERAAAAHVRLSFFFLCFTAAPAPQQQTLSPCTSCFVAFPGVCPTEEKMEESNVSQDVGCV